MKPIRIAMWSGPRNISSTMMRSFSSRSDTHVTDEPLYAHYLKKTGFHHSGYEEIIQSYNTDYNSIKKNLINDIPKGKTVWYQKHMAHHLDPADNLTWTNNLMNCLLIRNPNHVIESFINKNELKDANELGYPQLLKLFQYHNNQIPIVDAKDNLLNPKEMLRKLCTLFKISFEENMLSWNQGPHPQDGIWGKYWYDRLWKSTTFSLYEEKKSIISDRYKDILEKCIVIYDELYEHRIQSI